MKTNIWILNHYIDSYQLNTIERHRNFADELRRRGYRVSLIYSSVAHGSRYNEIKNGEHYRITKNDGITNIAIRTRNYKGNGKSRVLNMLDYYRGLLRNYMKLVEYTGKPDAIVASSVHLLTCKAGIKIGAKLNVPCIVEIRDLWPLSIVEYTKLTNFNPIVQLLYKMEKSIYEKADKLIFTMEGGREYISEKGWDKSIDIAKVYHINNGINLERFDQNVLQNHIEDKDLNDDGTFKITFTGSMGESDDVIQLVDVAKRLKDQGSNIKILAYGRGEQYDAIAARAREIGADNFILKPYVEKKFVPYILSRADACIMQTKSTSVMRFGCSLNKLFDYLAAGKPVISSFKANYSILQKYRCGVECEDSGIDAMVHAINTVYSLTDVDYAEMCRNSRLAAEHYDFKVLTDKLVEVIGD